MATAVGLPPCSSATAVVPDTVTNVFTLAGGFKTGVTGLQVMASFVCVCVFVCVRESASKRESTNTVFP